MLLQMIRSVTAAGILLAAAGVSGADETQQEYFILSRPVPATATGTVDYAKVTTLSFEAKGRLSFVEIVPVAILECTTSGIVSVTG